MARIALDQKHTAELRGKMYAHLAEYAYPKRKAVELSTTKRTSNWLCDGKRRQRPRRLSLLPNTKAGKRPCDTSLAANNGVACKKENTAFYETNHPAWVSGKMTQATEYSVRGSSTPVIGFSRGHQSGCHRLPKSSRKHANRKRSEERRV